MFSCPLIKNYLNEASQTWRLAWPMMVAQLAQIGSSFVDTAMSGHASSEDLAAVSVGNSIWIALFVAMIGFATAINPLASRYVGAREHTAIPGLVQQALIQGILLSLVLIVLAHLSTPIYPHLGLPQAATQKAQAFLIAIAWSLPALACFRTLSGYSASLGYTKPIMAIAILGLLLNIPLNWMLIYGHFGFPALGGVGCGYATAICMWFEIILLICWVRWGPCYRLTQPFTQWRGINWKQHRQLIQLGAPTALIFLVETSAFCGIALLVARLGETAVSSHEIALNCTSILFMAPSAYGHALTVKVAHALGEKNPYKAKMIGEAGLWVGILYAICACVLVWLFRSEITALYSNDSDVRRLSAVLLIYCAVFQLGDVSQTILAGILRGYKITKMPLFIYVASFWVVGIPMGYGLTFGGGPFAPQGVSGFWIALVIALTSASGLLLMQFRKVSLRELSE